jgi:hypothetical protein
LLPGRPSSPEELARFINAEIERWGKVIQPRHGIQVNAHSS